MILKNAVKKACRIRTSEVPRNLASVTTIETSQEVNPESVNLTKAGIEEIWNTVESIYKTGVHPGISLCIRKDDKIVMHRAIGHARGNGPDSKSTDPKMLMSPDTPVCYFSASKAVTALLVHMLNEEKLINLLDPVSFYAPEFGKNGKKNITIHQVLAHRSGIPGLPTGTPIETLWDNDEVWKLLCDASPANDKGDKISYHALTGGYVLERVLQHVTGMDIQSYIDKRLRKPMDMKYFKYGIDGEGVDLVAENYATGIMPFFPINVLVKRALGGSLDQVEEVTNDPNFKKAVIPAGNIMGTAEEINRFFQMMLNGGKWKGKQICDPLTVKRATQEFASLQFDHTLMMPMRYSAGLMLGGEPVGLWGKHSGAAYGHIGLMNKLCWADEARGISVALITTGVPILGSHLPSLVNFFRKIDKHCPREHLDAVPKRHLAETISL